MVVYLMIDYNFISTLLQILKKIFVFKGLSTCESVLAETFPLKEVVGFCYKRLHA